MENDEDLLKELKFWSEVNFGLVSPQRVNDIAR